MNDCHAIFVTFFFVSIIVLLRIIQQFSPTRLQVCDCVQ